MDEEIQSTFILQFMWANKNLLTFCVFYRLMKSDYIEAQYLCSSNWRSMYARIVNKIYDTWQSYHQVRQPVSLLLLPAERDFPYCYTTMRKKKIGESLLFIYLFTLINIKSNEKRKILSLSFWRDWRSQYIWLPPSAVIRACSKCSAKPMTSIRSKSLTKANFISVMLMILSIAMSSTMPLMPGARMNIRRTIALLIHFYLIDVTLLRPISIRTPWTMQTWWKWFTCSTPHFHLQTLLLHEQR